MKEWFSKNRVGIVALLITVAAWWIVAALLPNEVITIINAFAFGWFFLGGVVAPWVESKIARYL